MLSPIPQSLLSSSWSITDTEAEFYWEGDGWQQPIIWIIRLLSHYTYSGRKCITLIPLKECELSKCLNCNRPTTCLLNHIPFQAPSSTIMPTIMRVVNSSLASRTFFFASFKQAQVNIHSCDLVHNFVIGWSGAENASYWISSPPYNTWGVSEMYVAECLRCHNFGSQPGTKLDATNQSCRAKQTSRH